MAGGIEGGRPHVERTSQTSKPTEQPLQGRATGRESLQGPTTVDKSAQGGSERTRVQQPQPENALNRAVERTRDLYEKNGWTFLPLGGAGEGSPSEPNSQTEQTPQGGDTNRPKLDRPELKEEIPEVKDRIDAIRQAIRGGAFYSGVGLGDIPIKHKGKESAR